jgi:hypothetical protein
MVASIGEFMRGNELQRILSQPAAGRLGLNANYGNKVFGIIRDRRSCLSLAMSFLASAEGRD